MTEISEMHGSLSVAAKQDIGAFFQPIGNTVLERAAQRIGIELPGRFGDRKSSRIEWLLERDGLSEQVLRFLNRVLEEEGFGSETLESKKKALLETPLEPVVVDGRIQLVLADDTKPIEVAAREFLERVAPSTCSGHLHDAVRHLSNGSWGAVVGSCRQALEALTVGGQFDASLRELSQSGLISARADGGAGFDFDAEFLKNFRRFLSTLGTHSEHERDPPSSDHAQLVLGTTYDVLRFLLRRIHEGRTRNLVLGKWARLQE